MSNVIHTIAAQSTGANNLVKQRYATKDIIDTIAQVYQGYKHQAQPLASSLMRSNLNSTLQAIYTFVRSHVQYVEDGNEKQLVPSPARLLQKKEGDCKGMSILCASILYNMGIPCYFRYAKYSTSTNPSQYTHIYVIVPINDKQYIVLDPVYHKYGVEAPNYSGTKDVYCAPSPNVSGIVSWVKKQAGNVKDAVKDVVDNAADKVRDAGAWTVDKVKDVRDWTVDKAMDLANWANDINISQAIKTATLAPVRGAFLGVVRINVLALADLLNLPNDTRLSSTQRAQAANKVGEIRSKWYRWGGNRTELDSAIAKGAKERPIGTNLPALKNLDFVKKLRSSGIISGIGATGAEEGGTIAAAMPFLVEIGGILGSIAVIVAAVTNDSTPTDYSDSGNLPTDIPTDTTGTPASNKLPIIVGGLLLAYAFTQKTSRRK